MKLWSHQCLQGGGAIIRTCSCLSGTRVCGWREHAPACAALTPSACVPFSSGTREAVHAHRHHGGVRFCTGGETGRHQQALLQWLQAASGYVVQRPGFQWWRRRGVRSKFPGNIDNLCVEVGPWQMCLAGLDCRWKVLREVTNFSELWHKLEQKKKTLHVGWTQV